MSTRSVFVALLLGALIAGVAAEQAFAHAGLVRAVPSAGASLGAAPEVIQLTFSERPEPSLSTIHVIGPHRAAYEIGRPKAAQSDPLSLTVPLRRAGRGVYTLSYRVVSAVDGHATSGSFAFGVEVPSPAVSAAPRATQAPGASWLEVIARWALLAGLVAALGAAVAGVAGFAGSRGWELWLAGVGWLLALAGLALLAVAERNTARSSFSELFKTPVGDALLWRGVGVAALGGAVLVAWRVPRARRPALVAAALAALAVITVHVANGHAAAGSWPAIVTVSAQVAHFAAVGVWIGGLGALLLGIRGTPSAEKTAAVRRFAVFAAAGLAVVLFTGTLRAIDELSSFGQLTSTGYGRAILAKIVLIGLIAGLAARSRRRVVAAAATDFDPLRWTFRAELALASVALVAAALLGSLAPPVSARPGGLRSLSASGTDFAKNVRVRLTTASSEPGPNAFTARVADHDSGKPVNEAHVTLRFAPLDDPGVKSTTLALRSRSAGTYVGSGDNLAFVGRWRVTAVLQRGDQATDAPLELDVPGPIQRVSITRIPGQPALYEIEVGTLGYISVSPVPERAGASVLRVSVGDIFEGYARAKHVVVTTAAGDGRAHQAVVRRVATGRYDARIRLSRGRNTIVVVAYRPGVGRLWAQLHLIIQR